MKVAIAHYCEGAGHGTRMLAVAEAVEEKGHDVVIGGGGPGAKFVEINGFDEFRPQEVNYIDDYQNRGLLSTFTGSIPKSIGRIKDYIEWFRDEDPDLTVTDDMFAGVALTLLRKDFYFIHHGSSELYEDSLEVLGDFFWRKYFEVFAEGVIQPIMWENKSYISVGPIALEKEEDIEEDIDVLTVPSSHSEERLDEIEKKLEAEGREITKVGGEDWEIKKSLQPYIEDAEVVICSGYSTVMEAAVAGTPCLIIPETSEQYGISKLIDDKAFKLVESPEEALEEIKNIRQPREYSNGADEIADIVEKEVES
ncbi:MAG: glycosyltransferase [Candidatus Nanohalobium sp.]